MKFIQRMERAKVSVELKYCERCGGLWLRRQGTDDVYCKACMQHLAKVVDGLRGARFEKRTPVPIRIDCLQGVARVEVRA